MIKKFNSENFENEVSKYGSLVLVDFFAIWCGPCQMLSPVLDELVGDSELEELGLQIGKVDIDDSGDIAQDFGVMSVPTMILFKDGKEIKRITGFVPKEQLKEQILGSI